MFGFLIGGASLLGLLWVLRGGRHGGHGRRHRGGFRRRWLNMLFERLDTSPGQEKAVRAALDEVLARGRELRDDTMALRATAAQALRDQVFEASVLDDGFARQSVAVVELQKAVAEALASLHDTLDDEQRRRLANFMVRGPGHHRCRGAHRAWSGGAETWA